MFWEGSRSKHLLPVNVNSNAKGKCQRRVFQGVPGGKFWEGSTSEDLHRPVNVNNEEQEGNVREMSSSGSLDEGSRRVQEASTYKL